MCHFGAVPIHAAVSVAPLVYRSLSVGVRGGAGNGSIASSLESYNCAQVDDAIAYVTAQRFASARTYSIHTIPRSENMQEPL